MASTSPTEHLDAELRAHVEGMHPNIDRFLSDAAIRDEHRRDHDFGNPNHPSRHDRMTALSPKTTAEQSRGARRFVEGMAIENPGNIGNVPASDMLEAEAAVYRISQAEKHAAKVAFELRVTQLLDLMLNANSERNRRLAYNQAVLTVSASVKLGLGHGALPPYEEMTA